MGATRLKALIGITGKKGCGKSTLASLLAEEIPGAKIIAFADALKDDVADMIFDFSPVTPHIGRAWLDAHKATVFGPLLQGYGELMRLVVSTDYWVDVLASEIVDIDAVIIPDVRYENEAEFIHRNGGLLIAIEGPSRWEGDQRDASHPSETHVDKVRQLADVVVSNDSDLAHLQKRAAFIAMKAARVASGESMDYEHYAAARQRVSTGALP